MTWAELADAILRLPKCEQDEDARVLLPGSTDPLDAKMIGELVVDLGDGAPGLTVTAPPPPSLGVKIGEPTIGEGKGKASV